MPILVKLVKLVKLVYKTIHCTNAPINNSSVLFRIECLDRIAPPNLYSI